ncbi:hypothetical protein AALO_G00110310 [Alosa alosa]|uniref:Uncharacterized protein n=1 Tax=Alosa alosa TaxID=278164 RepID=A0AAV6GNR9_9TELE|nr:hypothetical protein AALO_G00110310 [Alosa alosa]
MRTKRIPVSLNSSFPLCHAFQLASKWLGFLSGNTTFYKVTGSPVGRLRSLVSVNTADSAILGASGLFVCERCPTVARRFRVVGGSRVKRRFNEALHCLPRNLANKAVFSCQLVVTSARGPLAMLCLLLGCTENQLPLLFCLL